jgi:hypothetical protein
MSTKTADISPTTSLIRALRDKDHPWKKMLGEFIDNSIDANAQNIELYIERRSRGRSDMVDGVVVLDDGEGCEDLQDLFKLGRHNADENTQIGEYGVGAKEMQIAIAERVTAFTRTNGRVSTCEVDYREIEERGSWEIQITEESDPEHAKSPPPSFPPSDLANGSTGMCIRLDVDRQKRLNSYRVERAIDRLSHQYRPALNAGRSIALIDGDERHELEAWGWPDLDRKQKFELDLPQGTATVTAGCLPSREDTRSGLHFVYGPRIIETRQKSIESEDRPVTLPPTFFAYVELSEGFALSTNKTSVQRSGQIERLISDRCEAVIGHCRQHSEQLKIDRLETGLLEDLQEITRKERRNTYNRDDTNDGKEPQGTDQTRENVEKTQSGNSSARGKGKGEKLTGLDIQVGPRGQNEFIDWQVVNDGWKLMLFVNSEHPSFQKRSMDEVRDVCTSVASALFAFGDLNDRLDRVLDKAGLATNVPLSEATDHAFRRIDDV